MRNFFQNKWLIAFLILLGIAVAGGFLLLTPQKTVERKGITLDREKLPQRQKQTVAEEKKESQPKEAVIQKEPVGSVTQIKGLAFAEIDKEKRSLEEGSPVFQGDRIITGNKARLILKMKDDAVIALGEDSEFVVQQYTFKVKSDNTVSEDDGNKGTVELNKGIAKFTSGRLGQLKNKPFHMVTPVATMGVRGTEGYVRLRGTGADQEIEVITLKDEVLVWMEEQKKDLSSSSGEIHFLTALIAEAIAADLGKEPVGVTKNKMLTGSPKAPPVVSNAPADKLKEARSNTVVNKLPSSAKQALAGSVAKSLVDKGVAASVEEAQKVLDKNPEALDKLVEATEDELEKESKAKISEQVEAEKQIEKIDEEIKKAEASGDSSKKAELDEIKQGLEGKIAAVEAEIKAGVDEKSADKALEKTASKVDSFAGDAKKAVAEGKSLQEVMEKKASEVKQDKIEKARSMGVEDLDKAKKASEKVREVETKRAEENELKQVAKGSGELSGVDAGAKTEAQGDSKSATSTGTAGEGKVGGAEGGTPGVGDGAKGVEAKAGETPKAGEGPKGEKTVPVGGGSKDSGGQDLGSNFSDAAKSTGSDKGSGTAAGGSSSSGSSGSSSTPTKPTPVVFNKPPVMAAQTFNVDENKPAKFLVGKLVATDPDVGNVLSYTLTPTDVFTVDAATGEITAKISLDHEKQRSYPLTATVTDNVPDNTKDKKITTVTAAIVINVNNINEAPVVTLPGALSVDEDTLLQVSGISMVDPDVISGVDADLSAKLEVTRGVITLTDSAGLTITGGASGSKSLTVKGKLDALNGALGKLTYKPEQDFNGSDTLKVDVDDLGTQGSGGPLTAGGSVAITVKAVNDPPVLSTASPAFTLNENSPAEAEVGSVTATDVEKDVLTYAIAKGNQGNVFVIDAKGKITVNKEAKLDYETTPVYTLEVSVTDSGSPPKTLVGGNAVVTVRVNNINETPTLTMPAVLSVNEDTPLQISGVVVTDPDLVGPDAALQQGDFSVKLDVGKGVITLSDGAGVTVSAGSLGSKSVTLKGKLAALNAALGRLGYLPEKDFFGADSLKVEVNDLGNSGSGEPLSASGSVAITIKPVNDPPVLSGAGLDFAVSENSPEGAVVGAVTATDLENDALTYAIQKGNQGNVFAIDAKTGQITVNKDAKLDYETTKDYTLEVSVTDSGTPPQPLAKGNAIVTIQVKNVNEVPTVTLPAALSVNEDTLLEVTGISVADPDVAGQEAAAQQGEFSVRLEVGKGIVALAEGTGVTVSSGSSGSKSMTLKGKLSLLNSALGKVTYKPDQDYNGGDTLGITVDDLGVLGSGGPLTASGGVIVTVKPVNDPPVLTSVDLNFAIDENSPAGAAVGSVTATDVDKDVLTYAIQKGNQGNVFAIDEKTGKITVNKDAKLDYETTPSYTLEVAVTDAGSPPQTLVGGNAVVAIQVKNVNEVPTLSLPGTLILDEDTGAKVSGVAIADPDVVAQGGVTAAGGDFTVELAAAKGVLFIDDTAGVAVAAGSSGAKAMTLKGKVNALNVGLGTLRYLPDAEYNGGDVIFVTVDDLGNSGSGGPRSASGSVIVTVKAVNDPPVFSPLEYKATLNENVLAGAVVGEVKATDIEKDVVLFDITKGNTGNAFTIDANTGQITVNKDAKLDYEANPVYTLEVSAKDSGPQPQAGGIPAKFVIELKNLNEPPVFTSLPDTINALEDTVKVITGIEINDPDLTDTSTEKLKLTLTVEHGTLSVRQDHSLNEKSLVLTASLADLRKELVKLNYRGELDFFGADFLTLKLEDQGNLGSGTTTPATGVVSISVVSVNDTPSITPINNVTIDEDKTSGILNFQVGDIDSKASELTVTVTSANADLLPAGSMVLSGTEVDRSLTLIPGANRFGEAVITLTVTDTNKGSSAAQFKLTVNPVADLPVVTSASTDEDIQTATGLVITPSNVDGTEVTHFYITNIVKGLLYKKDGTTVIKNGDFITVAEGASGLRFTPGANLNSDGGANVFGFDVQGAVAALIGSAGPEKAAAVVTVTGVNDAPVITKPANQTVNEDTDLPIAGLSIADVDAGTGNVQVTLVAGKGTLTLANVAGVSVDSGANGSGSMVLSGTLEQINKVLPGLTYRGNANVFGNDTLTIKADDLGNKGTGTALKDEKAITITVVAVNDLPVVTQGAASLSFTEGNSVGNNTPIVIDGFLKLGDVDDTNLTGATVAISSGFDVGKDSLNFTNTASITKDWDATKGVLTLTGTASVSDYQAALASVTYTSTSDDPAAGPRVVTIKATDGKDESVAAVYSLTVVPVNDPPTMTAGGTLSHVENSVAAPFDTTFSVTDLDNATMSGATVTITSGYQNNADGADVLAFTDTSTITGSWSAVDGRLTLTGVASKTAYALALRSVTYFHNGDNPATAIRTVSTSVNDGKDSSVPVTSTVTVTAVNDVPVVTSKATVTFTEGVDAVQNQAVVIDGQMTVFDAERDTLTGATITISTNYVNGEDVLIFPANVGGISADTNNGSDGGIGGWNSNTHTLKLVGSGTVAEYQTALRTVMYNNLDSGNPTGSTRTIAFYVSDTGQSLPATLPVAVLPQNDTPILTGGGTPLATYTEDSPASKHADNIDNGLTLTDVDNTNLAGATVTITQATLFSGKSVLAFTSSYSSPNIVGSFNANTGVFTLTGADTVANYQAALRAVTYSNSSDNPAAGNRVIEFRVTDGTLTSAKVVRTILVVPVNDAPTIVAGGTKSYTENDLETVVQSTIAVTDLEGDSMLGATARITGSDGTTTYTEDRLSFAGRSDVSAGYTNGDGITGVWNNTTKTLTFTGTVGVAEYQAALATVTYINFDATTNATNNNPTAGDRKVTFTVTDSPGDGSTPLVSNVAAATVTVVAVNDAPTLAAPTATVTYTEPSVLPMPVIGIDPSSQLTITDPESNQIQGATIVVSGVPATTGDGPADTLIFASQNGITGTWNSSTLTLTLSGTASLANYQTALRSVTYTNSSQDPGAGTRTLTWRVTDDGGGSAISSAVTSSLTVVAYNNAPVIANGAASITYFEDEEPENVANENHKKVVNSSVTVTDVDNGSMSGATVTITPATYQNGQDVLTATVQGSVLSSWDAGTGVLTLSGTDTKAVYTAVLRTVTYQNTSDNPITVTRNIQYVVNDGAASSSSTDIANMQNSVNVIATNDAPVLANGSVSVLTFTEQKDAVTIADQSSLGKQPPEILNTGIVVTDAENNMMQGATVQITGNYGSTEDVLDFVDTLAITHTWNATTGTLTLAGSDTIGNYLTALRAITYQNTNVANPSSLTRTVTWSITDGQPKNPTSALVYSTVIVIPVNDSPILAGGGAVLAYTEDSPSENHAAIIDATVTMTDAENNNINSATVKISTNYKAVDVGSFAQDSLSYAGNGTTINAGVWNATNGTLTINTTAGQVATMADYMTAFHNIKYTNSSDAPDAGVGNQRTITWQVVDAGGLNSSSSTATSSIVVAKTNDTPTNIQISNNGMYASSPVGTVIGHLTTSDPDLVGDTYTYTLTAGTTEFGLANGKDTSIYTSGDLTVNLATLSATGGPTSNGVYPVTVQVTDAGVATFTKSLNITVVPVLFSAGDMTTVGDATQVATLVASSKTIFNTLLTNLFGPTPQNTTLTNDNLRTMILAKLNQQLSGNNAQIAHIGGIIDQMGVSVTNDPKVVVTMRIKALSTIHNRLPASVQTSFKNLVDTFLPYDSNFFFDVRLTVVPVVSGSTITYNNASSKVEVLHLKVLPDVLAPLVPSSVDLDTLAATYNGVLPGLKGGSLAFFLGGALPKWVLENKQLGLGNSGSVAYQQMSAQSVWNTANSSAMSNPGWTVADVNAMTMPNSTTGIRLDYYLPGKISTVTFNSGNITIVK